VQVQVQVQVRLRVLVLVLVLVQETVSGADELGLAMRQTVTLPPAQVYHHRGRQCPHPLIRVQLPMDPRHR
jgi:hypothetical protein